MCYSETPKYEDPGSITRLPPPQEDHDRRCRRVEVTVPSQDTLLIKAIASTLRSDGEEAELIRQSLQPILTIPRARIGAELVAFLRTSPFTDAESAIERDRSTGRSANLG